ncbi:MAG: hypothetical protein LBV00_03580, partial [Propionibacteriaceae bacterium]|nr:hypothetical protein [Propionibacteriaceae bacterium]
MTRTRRRLPQLLGALLGLCLLVGLTGPVGTPTAQAVPASQWNPGMIISDEDFYNSSAMDAGQIQSFLEQKGSSCHAGSAPCMKDYRQSTPTHAADAYCGRYEGSSNESAAQIIDKVSKACGINPQVLLVNLQKENSLITSQSPSTWSYRTAMGYGCPDTAECDAAYFGFANQVYRAARQFKLYAAFPNSFSYRAGAWNNILYNPSSSCGSSPVFIKNQATASLYIYTPYQPNAAALANLYGTGDGCSAYGNRNFWTYFTDWFGPSAPTLGVTYSAHGKDYGWQSAVRNGSTAGTTGQSRRVEALTASLTAAPAGSSIGYTAYLEGKGWQLPVYDGAVAGTTGQSRQVEAVTFTLTGPIATTHDIWYRVHVAEQGWLDWASDGDPAGSVGKATRIEAIQMKLLAKGETPGPTEHPFIGLSLSYSAHVAEVGWQKADHDGNVAGTTGQSLRLEAMKVALEGAPAGSKVSYSLYQRGGGWQPEVSNGGQAGTTGRSLATEGARFNLSGPIATTHDIWYRSHVSNIGWLDWTKNGDPSGASAMGEQLEAVQVLVVPKSFPAPGATSQPYRDESVSYAAHVEDSGWLSAVTSGELAGTTGKSKRLESVKVSLTAAPAGSNVNYSVHVQEKGWLPRVANGQIGGTVGQSLRAEAIAISLSGPIAQTSSIWYRAHVAEHGWLGWASDGAVAGSSGLGLRMEAIEILILPKGVKPSGGSGPAALGNGSKPSARDARSLDEPESTAEATTESLEASAEPSPSPSTTVSSAPSPSDSGSSPAPSPG